MKSFKEAVLHRRSVRDFAPDSTMNTETVKQCIEMATLSANSSNMQLWEFYHITSKEILQKLARACFSQKAARTAQEMVVFVVRKDLYKLRATANLNFARMHVPEYSPPQKVTNRLKRMNMYYGKAMPLLYANYFGIAGVLRKIGVNMAGLFKTPMYRQVSNNDMRVVAHKSTALAAQTFMLAMAAEGYDTCPMEGLDSRMVKKILELPQGAEINMVIACGIRNGNKGIYGNRFRIPFDEVYKKIDQQV